MTSGSGKSVTGKWVNKNIRIDGKTVLITGANTGIGFECSKDLSARGAKVLMACRDMEKCNNAIKKIKESHPDANLVPVELDLASLESVRKCAENVKNSEEKLDILINNAGIMACPQWNTKDGFEMHLGVNHIGHFLLTNLLLDLLKKSAPSRIVVVSSIVHEQGRMNWDDMMSEKNYVPFTVYSHSKLANVLFSRYLSKKLEGTGVTCNSLHPGLIRTELGRHMFSRDTCWSLFKYYMAVALTKCIFIDPPQGAQTSIYCAIAPELEGVTGKYFAACKEKRESAAAQNDADAERLWKLSMEWTGLEESQDTSSDTTAKD